ncbi:serpin family protein [Halopenitus sp. H-Gu1]|uniref:serpin family protein n=1 Tax=Halopenitus sp. H-Gu1 TaxID=3242697 RepID=UPI00359EA9DA
MTNGSVPTSERPRTERRSELPFDPRNPSIQVVSAATGVVIRADSAPMDPFEFIADRPFLFAIRDRPTGVVLFVGRAVDPAGWE